jgi:hypothetical protein
VRNDRAVRRWWAGEEVDLGERLPSLMILTAARADPEIERGLGPYLGMRAGPDSLEALEHRARAVYAAGWRPTPDPGPNRAELVELVQAAVARAG